MQSAIKANGKVVGIFAVQGDFELHAKMLDRIGAPWRLVKHPADLAGVDRLIIPGGESTTMLKFFEEEGLGPAILNFAGEGKPIFGTCAGAILLAKEVLNPRQSHLGLIDITVERNAYGRQIDSAVKQGTVEGVSESGLPEHAMDMVFIRARPSSAGSARACACSAAPRVCPCLWSRTTSWRPPFTPN